MRPEAAAGVGWVLPAGDAPALPGAAGHREHAATADVLSERLSGLRRVLVAGEYLPSGRAAVRWARQRGARVGVVGGLDEAAARALGDPRVRLLGEPDGGAASAEGLPPTPARGDLEAVRSVPDWSVDVRVPLRPAAAGARPDADAVAAWLLRLERAGVERVEVLGEPGERAERGAVSYTHLRAHET